MEDKKEQTPSQSTVNNSVNNFGANYGTMGHTVNQGTSNTKMGDAASSTNTVQTSLWKDQVIRLISESKTEEALAEILKTNPTEDIRMQVALLAGRFSQLRIQRIAGILDKELELKEQNSIRNGILALISRF